jgi:hypothetical protein
MSKSLEYGKPGKIEIKLGRNQEHVRKCRHNNARKFREKG